MIQHNLLESLSSKLGPPVFTGGDEVRFNCYKRRCGSSESRDTNYHMYVNVKKGKFFCHRCQSGGTLEFLSRVTGIGSIYGGLNLWSLLMEELAFPSKRQAKHQAESANVDLPCTNMHKGTRAHLYLLSRGITDEMVEFYKIGIGIGKARNRVVFPDYFERKLVYWVARDYVGRQPKYLNAKEPRERQVYNLWFARTQKKIVICEGVISALMSGCNAVATYGKYVTLAQIGALLDAHADEYIVAFDGDAREYGVSLASRLLKSKAKVKIALFPTDKDPGDLGYLKTKDILNSAKSFSSGFDSIGVFLS